LLRKRIATELAFLVLLVAVLYASSNDTAVYAVGTVSIVPSSVPQGVSFQVFGSGYAGYSPGPVYVDVLDAGCGAVQAKQTVTVPPSGSFGPVTFLSDSLGVGVHCIGVDISGALDFDGFSSVTVTAPVSSPAGIASMPVGGDLLAINQFQIILPWLVLFAVLTVVSAWTLTVTDKREVTRRK
jgi:hypothetical protein